MGVEMKTWLIETKVETLRFYEVEAESAEEARALFDAGTWEFSGDEEIPEVVVLISELDEADEMAEA
jgi:hypothetical protein